MVAAGLLGALSLAFIKLTSTGMKSAKTVESRYEINNLTEEIRTLLKNPDACKNSFMGVNASDSGSSITAIRDKNNQIKYFQGQRRGSATINDFALSDSAPEVSATPSSISDTNLVIGYSKGSSTYGGDIQDKIKLWIETDASLTIINCVAYGGTEANLWSRSTVNTDDIFYNNGNVAIGHSVPQVTLDVLGSIQSLLSGPNSKVGFNLIPGLGLSLDFLNSSGSPIAEFAIDSSQNLNIKSNSQDIIFQETTGNIGIGTSSPVEKLTVNGDISATAYKGVNFHYTSDRRLKKDFTRLTVDDSQEVMKISSWVYKWKNNNHSDVGFIAQEVEEVIPHIVSESKDGIKRVDYGKLTPYLLEIIKEHHQKINQLEKLIQQQKIRIQNLER